MNIKFLGADGDKHTPATTNIGTFYPGEVITVSDSQEAFARQLVDGGEFEETEDDGSGNEKIRAAAKKRETKEAVAEHDGTADDKSFVERAKAKVTGRK